MNQESVLQSYRRYSRVYDLLFGPALEPGRRLALQALGAMPGQSILEIGVGTGLALPHYPEGVRLHGVDLSSEMLALASARARGLGRDITLRQMDAQRLEYGDASFDACVAMYVASVAPDPAAMLGEMRRVTRPGGRLVVLNHFSRRGGWAEGAERFLSRWSRQLGFKPLFYLDDFTALAGAAAYEARPVPPWGYWQVLSWKRP